MKISRTTNFLKLVLLVMLTVAVTLPVSAQTGGELICEGFVDSPDAERITYYMGKGVGHLQARQYSAAIQAYSCIIEQLDDEYIGAYNQRAVAYTMQQDYENAIEDYDTVLAIDAQARAALNNRGIVYAALREFDLARADFDAVIAVDSEYVAGYLNRGIISAIQSDFEAAIVDLEQAIDISGIDDTVADLRDPDRPQDAPRIVYDRDHAQMYAILGVIYSGFALENYNDYLLLRGGSGDQRVQSAAGSLESRFNFELRLDDGTWLLRADFGPTGEEIAP